MLIFCAQELQTTEDNDGRNVQKVQELQIHLQSLTQTDSVIKHICTERAETLTDPDAATLPDHTRIGKLLEVKLKSFISSITHFMMK